MEKIYLTEDEKQIIRKMLNLPSYGIGKEYAELDQEKFNIIMYNLESKGLVSSFGRKTQAGYHTCILTEKALSYLDANPELKNPKTEEEKERDRRMWDLKMNAANWIITIFAAVIGGVIGYYMGKC